MLNSISTSCTPICAWNIGEQVCTVLNSWELASQKGQEWATHLQTVEMLKMTIFFKQQTTSIRDEQLDNL